MSVTAAQERPVFYQAGENTLFGLHAAPEGNSNGVGVVIIQGGDTVNVSLLRNRMAVRLARDLAGRGHHVMRFDYRGLGESGGESRDLDLDHPLEVDAVNAAAELVKLGCSKIVLLGACFSGRTALAAAPHVPEVVGVIMSTPPLSGFTRGYGFAEQMAREKGLGAYVRAAVNGNVLKGLFHPGRRELYRKLAATKLKQLVGKVRSQGREEDGWVSLAMLEAMKDTVRRRVPVLIVYGTDDPFLREFDRAARGRLGRVIADSNGSVEVSKDIPGELHGFPDVEGQRAFHQLAVEWIARRCT